MMFVTNLKFTGDIDCLWPYFFTAAQTALVAEPMLFKWTRQLGQYRQQ